MKMGNRRASMFALVLACAVVSGGAETAKIKIHGIDRATLSAAADDTTMREIPPETGTLFMLAAKNISPDGMKQLAHLRRLDFLRIKNSQHGDAALRALSGHPALKKLMMWSVTGMDANGIAELSSVRTLRSVGFSRVELSALAWKALPVGLEQLEVFDCQLGDEGLAAMPTFPRLKSFTLKGDNGVTEAGLTAFIKRHPGLNSLSVDNRSATFLNSLAEMPQLKSLWIGGAPESPDAWRAIGQLDGLGQLWVSASASEVFAKQVAQLTNPRLEYVDFRGKHIHLAKSVR